MKAYDLIIENAMVLTMDVDGTVEKLLTNDYVRQALAELKG